LSEWHLDRLPGGIRREAEVAAQQAGLPLHRWLAKVIRETCEGEGVAPSRELSTMRGGTEALGGSRAPPPRVDSAPVETSRPQPARPTPRPSDKAAATPDRPDGRPVAAPRPEPTPIPTPTSPPRPTDIAVAPIPAAPETPAEPEIPAAPVAAPRRVPAERARVAAAMPRLVADTSKRPARIVAEPSRAAAAPSETGAKTDKTETPSPRPKPTDEREAALSQLVANLRRNELSPLEEARLYLRLMTEFTASIGEITAATGRTREQVSRTLRLLGLSDRLRDLIDNGALTREQAFALLDAGDPEATLASVRTTAAERRAT
jgi:hypothetical protein